MTSETDWLGSQVAFAHDSNGNPTGQTNGINSSYPAGSSSTSFSFDNADNNTAATSTLAQTCGGNETLTQAFSGTGGSRNADGQVTQDSETYSGSCSGQTSYQRNYSYDAAGRVTYQGSSTQGANPNNFAYDYSGDPTTISSHDTSNNFDTYTQTFDNAGEITAQSPISGSHGVSATYTYDTLGDQITAVPGSNTTTYSFNQIGQMTATTTPSSSATYLYSGDGLTAGTTTSGGTAQFSWNTTGSLALILSDSANDYIYGPTDQPVEQIGLATSTPTYLTYTSSDSSWVSTNQAGDETGYWRYDAYGNLAFGTPTSPFGYSGQYLDITTGLVNDRARWYQPQTGAFQTRDPEFPKTDIAYVFANDDPVNRWDPAGLNGSASQSTSNFHSYLSVQGSGTYVDRVFVLFADEQTNQSMYVRMYVTAAAPAYNNNYIQQGIWSGQAVLPPAYWIEPFAGDFIKINPGADWNFTEENAGAAGLDEINTIVQYATSTKKAAVFATFQYKIGGSGTWTWTHTLECFVYG